MNIRSLVAVGTVAALLGAGCSAGRASPSTELQRAHAVDTILREAAVAEHFFFDENRRFTARFDYIAPQLEIPEEIWVGIAWARADGYCLEAFHRDDRSTLSHISYETRAVDDGVCPEPTIREKKKARRERLATPDPRYKSIPHAVRVIQKRLDFPVLVPSGLDGWRVGPRPAISFYDGSAQLDLRKGRKQILIVQFGRVGFDGCGADAARPVTIRGKPGLVNGSFGPPVGVGPWSEVIWPATPEHPEGRYGLSGTFTTKEIVKLARTMERARAEMKRKGLMGC